MPVPVVKVCRACGSIHTWAKARASWDIDAQDWRVAEVFDKGAHCEDCGGDTRLNEVPCEEIAECSECDWHGHMSHLIDAEDDETQECPKCGSIAHII